MSQPACLLRRLYERAPVDLSRAALRLWSDAEVREVDATLRQLDGEAVRLSQVPGQVVPVIVRAVADEAARRGTRFPTIGR